MKKIKGWFIKKYKGHGTFNVCKIESQQANSNQTYCLKIGSPSFAKASANGLAPKIRKTIGVFVVYDSDTNYTVVTSDIPANADLMPLVLKEISRLHKLGLSYEGKIYVDKRNKRVHFTRFRSRDDMSPLDWVLEQIKDYYTITIMHQTEYSNDKRLKWFMKRIDKLIYNIAEIL